MKSIFDQSVRDEIVNRINQLDIDCKPAWGKMNVGQMVRHCSICEEYYFGKIKLKRSLLGRIVGKSAIKSILKDEATGLRKNSPALPIFQVNEVINDLDAEKKQWITIIERYSSFQTIMFTHWFFGKMTKEQLGYFIYKHDDHHLKQFGV